MRYVTLISLLFLQFPGFSQVGQSAAQIAIDIGTSTLPETETLVAINLHQKDVLDYSKKISEKTAAIVVLKEAELLSLNTTPDGFQETTPYKHAFISVDAIIQLNTNTLQLVQDFPDVETIPVTVTAAIIEKAYAGFSDIQSIIADGKDNLMSPTNRFILVENVNKYLDKLVEISRFLNILVRTSVLTAGDVPTDYTYDITEPLNRILQDIDNLIIE